MLIEYQHKRNGLSMESSSGRGKESDEPSTTLLIKNLLTENVKDNYAPNPILLKKIASEDDIDTDFVVVPDDSFVFPEENIEEEIKSKVKINEEKKLVTPTFAQKGVAFFASMLS